MKPSAAAILNYLLNAYPRFVSVPELAAACHQTDVRKRVSELKRLEQGFTIEKERRGAFVNYRARAVA